MAVVVVLNSSDECQATLGQREIYIYIFDADSIVSFNTETPSAAIPVNETINHASTPIGSCPQAEVDSTCESRAESALAPTRSPSARRENAARAGCRAWRTNSLMHMWRHFAAI